MPAKGKGLKNGERYNPLDKKLWKQFCEKTGIEIDYFSFRDIIWTTNEMIQDAIADDNAGLELYEGLGHAVVSEYKPIKLAPNWPQCSRLDRFIPQLNLHSLGYMYTIKWFKQGTRVSNINVYRLEPYRILKRRVAANIKAGKKYFKWENSDFWSTTKLERTYSKFYKKDK